MSMEPVTTEPATTEPLPTDQLISTESTESADANLSTECFGKSDLLDHFVAINRKFQ